MNSQNRKDLQKAVDLINEANSIIETIRDEEQEKFDNLSEGLQASERGQAFEENADNLDSVFSDLENAIDSINDLI